MPNPNTLQTLIDNAQNIVFFGGAGVSTASGIPDFRSTDGIYNQDFDHPPEVMLSRSFYDSHKEEFFRFYRTMIYDQATPNAAHTTLAALEKSGKLKAVITQNIDGLHQKAGSENVLELHGSVLRNYCESCHVFYDDRFVMAAEGVPHCTLCGGDVKPDVVLYEEALNGEVISQAAKAVQEADLMIVGGTSLRVYPAAGFVDMYNGDLVIINRDATPYDHKATLLLHDNIADIFSNIQVN